MRDPATTHKHRGLSTCDPDTGAHEARSVVLAYFECPNALAGDARPRPARPAQPARPARPARPEQPTSPPAPVPGTTQQPFHPKARPRAVAARLRWRFQSPKGQRGPQTENPSATSIKGVPQPAQATHGRPLGARHCLYPQVESLPNQRPAFPRGYVRLGATAIRTADAFLVCLLDGDTGPRTGLPVAVPRSRAVPRARRPGPGREAGELLWATSYHHPRGARSPGDGRRAPARVRHIPPGPQVGQTLERLPPRTGRDSAGLALRPPPSPLAPRPCPAPVRLRLLAEIDYAI